MLSPEVIHRRIDPHSRVLLEAYMNIPIITLPAVGATALEGSRRNDRQTRDFHQVVDVMESLDFDEGRQPPYSDREGLIAAMKKMAAMRELGATIDSVYQTRAMYASRAVGDLPGGIWIVNGCETVVSHDPDDKQAITDITGEKIATIDAVMNIVGQDGEVVDRSCTEKPRSAATENGLTSYMGGAVNTVAKDEASRRPKPHNLVVATAQDRQVQAVLREKYKGRVTSSQEMLVLARGAALIRQAPNGKQVSLQSEMLWVGVRTGRVDGPHIDLISRVDNTVAVKIGPSHGPADIKALAEKLNPANEPGKLAFIFRLGPDHRNKLGPLLEAIKQYATEAVVIGDIVHGITVKLPNGQKTRVAADAISEGTTLIEACEQRGMICGGFMIETIGSNTRKECVSDYGELPTHTSNVDPGFNLRQTRQIVTALHTRLMAANL